MDTNGNTVSIHLIYFYNNNFIIQILLKPIAGDTHICQTELIMERLFMRFLLIFSTFFNKIK